MQRPKNSNAPAEDEQNLEAGSLFSVYPDAA
jgi:hypothetical protein